MLKKPLIIALMAVSLSPVFRSSDVYSALTPDRTWDKPSSFEPMSRGEMFRIAFEMKDFGWQPLNEIRNDTGTLSGRETYSPLQRYQGIAYTKTPDIEDWENFYELVRTVPTPQDTAWGNDCSGLVSISWKLPTRYNTTAFECDAFSGYGCSIATDYL